jgi:hypothetical protein
MKIEKRAFEEAQYLAGLAIYGKLTRMSPKDYWFAAMLSLREAYGK